MYLIDIEASPRQLSKLRNGHKVRVKKGTGCSLVVNPMMYDRISRSFGKSKAIDVQLTPEEIDANEMFEENREELSKSMNEKGLPLSMAGSGIFGKVKRGFKKAGKTLGRVGKKVIVPGLKTAYKFSKPALKIAATEALKEGTKMLPGLMAGAVTALGAPELAPAAGILGKQLGSYANQEGQKQIKGMGRKPVPKVLSDAGIGYYEANAKRSDYERQSVRGRKEADALRDYYDEPYAPISRGVGLYAGAGHYTGRGLYAGSGLYAGRGLYAGSGLFAGGQLDAPRVGQNGKFVQYMPPALQSQPYSANYHFQFSLPPQYQKYEQGSGEMFY
jgi:hypothetical protein